MLTPPEIDHLIHRIVGQMQPRAVIVFGSYAKGTATFKSDLDLLIIKETTLPMAHRADELAPLLTGFRVNVDVHVYTPEEAAVYGQEPFSFVESILKSGRVAFQK